VRPVFGGMYQRIFCDFGKSDFTRFSKVGGWGRAYGEIRKWIGAGWGNRKCFGKVVSVLGHEPLRVCSRKLLTPSPPVSQFTYENKGWGSRFQKLKSLVYASHTLLSLCTLSLYTLAYTLLRMSLRSHYSLSYLLLLALHLCESSLGRWL
jgi:hypothetical protein